ncbi:MAG: hypothetical protein IJJ26_10295 [Victivallales bacterium]|nr:hypothetical protein [Victivallales bacterium]
MGEILRNVLDYGAKGDGKTLDTAAIQKAIDAGGIIHFPAGTYLTGTIYLKSNGGLDLAPGAVILGSPDKKDYNASDFCPQNRPDSAEQNWSRHLKKMTRPMDWSSGAHLIVGLNVHDIIIRGPGTISGNRDAFGPIAVEEPEKRVTTPMPWRPGEMIWICESDRITMDGIRLIDAPFWTCVLSMCNEVKVRNLTVDMNLWTRNGDGFTIDGCQNVVMTNCIISAADDCIVLKSDHRRTFRKQACENVSISNCVLKTTCYGVRVGVGNGIMRNIRVDNIVCTGRIAAFVGVNFGLVKEISNVTFSNFTVNCEKVIQVKGTDWVRLKRPEEDVLIHDLLFTNFKGSCVNVCAIEPDVPVRDIRVEHLDLKLRQIDRSLCPYRELPNPPAPIIVKKVHKLHFKDVRIDWVDPWSSFQSPIVAEEVYDLRLDQCELGGRKIWGTAESFPKPTEEMIKYRKSWEKFY